MQGRRITDIPGIMHLWQLDNLFLAGQPTAETLQALKDQGIKKVFNLRGEDEADQSEIINIAKELGMEYEQFPIIVQGQLDKDNCEKLSSQLTDEKFFIHCGSANRVGGWLITYLVKYKNIDFDDAVDIASENGLTNPGFANQAQDILEG